MELCLQPNTCLHGRVLNDAQGYFDIHVSWFGSVVPVDADKHLQAPVTSQIIKDKKHNTKLINEFSVLHQSTVSLTLQPNFRSVHHDGRTPITLRGSITVITWWMAHAIWLMVNPRRLCYRSAREVWSTVCVCGRGAGLLRFDTCFFYIDFKNL